LFFSNSPGIGKTSIVTALIKDLNADVCWINGSKDSGIDILRTRVVDFSTSVSIDDSVKIVVIDEGDYLGDKTQAALRGVIEEFSNNVSFIITCNYVERLIPALIDRFMCFDFDEIYQKNKKELAGKAYKRLVGILKNENIEFSDEELKHLVINYYPAMRKMVMTLEKHSINGKLDLSSAVVDVSLTFKTIMTYIKNKEFSNLRKELASLSEASGIYSFVFKNLDQYFSPKSQPQVIILCAKYQDMNSSARDKTITATAFCVELMGTPGIELI
jgi:replication factor C small subunit